MLRWINWVERDGEEWASEDDWTVEDDLCLAGDFCRYIVALERMSVVVPVFVQL